MRDYCRALGKFRSIKGAHFDDDEAPIKASAGLRAVLIVSNDLPRLPNRSGRDVRFPHDREFHAARRRLALSLLRSGRLCAGYAGSDDRRRATALAGALHDLGCRFLRAGKGFHARRTSSRGGHAYGGGSRGMAKHLRKAGFLGECELVADRSGEGLRMARTELGPRG